MLDVIAGRRFHRAANGAKSEASCRLEGAKRAVGDDSRGRQCGLGDATLLGVRAAVAAAVTSRQPSVIIDGWLMSSRVGALLGDVTDLSEEV